MCFCVGVSSQGTVLTGWRQDWLHWQTTNQKTLLLQMSYVTISCNSWVWLCQTSSPTKFAVLVVCSAYPTLVGCLVTAFFFFFLTHHQSFYPRDWLRMRGRWSVMLVCSVSHMPLGNYWVRGAASPWRVHVHSAGDWHFSSGSHIKQISGPDTHHGPENICRGPCWMPLTYNFALSWASNGLPWEIIFWQLLILVLLGP